MKKLFAIILLSLALVGSMSAQTVKPQHKRVAVTKSVSGYMRNMGILYIEMIEELGKECQEVTSDSCDRALDRSDSTFQAIEDRIDITLSESRRPTGDMPYWRLLKNEKFSLHMYLYDGRASKTTKRAWGRAYLLCGALPRNIALTGVYESDGGCRDAVSEAMAPTTEPPDDSYCKQHANTDYRCKK